MHRNQDLTKFIKIKMTKMKKTIKIKIIIANKE